jgi:hypothetical protein
MVALRLAGSDGFGSPASKRPWLNLAETLSQNCNGLGVDGGGLVSGGSIGSAVVLPQMVLTDGNLPSRESLMTLLWVLRRRRHDQRLNNGHV